MPRDLYAPVPPRAVSRRAFLGLARDRSAPPPRPVTPEWLRALEPVVAALVEAAPGPGLDLPPSATDLPDGPFDAVRSCFAAVAPSRLVRATRPGGVVALAAWSPRSLPGRLEESDDDALRRRLEGFELRTRSVQLRFPDADALAAALGVGPGLRDPFDRLLASCNNLREGVEVDARYLLAIGDPSILRASPCRR